MARSKPAALPLGDTPTVMPDKDYQTPLKMAGVLGFEPRNGEIKTRCLTAWRCPNSVPRPSDDRQRTLKMAGVLGFEPRDGEIKTR